jgi:hypothetical protein
VDGQCECEDEYYNHDFKRCTAESELEWLGGWVCKPCSEECFDIAPSNFEHATMTREIMKHERP